MSTTVPAGKSLLRRPAALLKCAGVGVVAVLGFFPLLGAVLGTGETGDAATALWVLQMAVLGVTGVLFVLAIGSFAAGRRG